MTKVKAAPKSFERWKLSLDEFLWNYGFTLEDFSIDFEKLFKQGVAPDKALQMILGLDNLPEENIQEHYLEDVDTYLVPLLDEC